MFLLNLLIKCTKHNFFTSNIDPEIPQNNQIDETFDLDIEKILAEPHDEIKDVSMVDLDEIYMKLSPHSSLESNKIFDLNIKQIISDNDKTHRTKEYLNNQLEHMERKFSLIEEEKNRKLSEFTIKTLQIKFDEDELKVINNIRTNISHRSNKYRDVFKTTLQSLIDRIKQLNLEDNTVTINILKFIDRLARFTIPESHNIKLKYDSLLLKDYYKLDIWKLKTVIERINLKDTIENIINFFEDKIKDNYEDFRQILEDLHKLRKVYLKFCKYKMQIISKIEEVINIITRKQTI
ncbi:uncharacterized protein VNE69_02109 [Vairimorpha necatrix]|uniref:Uncharacterized protein n=1 Tax=Vairimorpha necatrix TaxID=6039 RepID=A0AAX4J9E6_9MICR